MKFSVCLSFSFQMPLTTISRRNQPWYNNGKSNECERFQKQHIEHVTMFSLNKTHIRLHLPSSTLQHVPNPNLQLDGFDYSENFDGVQHFGDYTIYYNLKMVCGKGGAQTRTLREVYHFIRSQLQVNAANVFFLDGDESLRHHDKFMHVVSGSTFVFVGV